MLETLDFEIERSYSRNLCDKRFRAVATASRVLAVVKDTFLQFPFDSPVIHVHFKHPEALQPLPS